MCSHLGRPKGPDPAFSMAPVEARLRELLADERLVVLENTRFHPGETKNDPGFAKELADERDLFVMDAFGSAHRAHASTVGVAELLPAYAGLLLERELEMLGRLLGEVERPFALISGGAKVEDKLGVLRNLGGRADEVLVGGKMAEEIRESNPLEFEVVLPVDVVAAAGVRGRRRDEGRPVRRAAGRLARSRHRAGDASTLRRSPGAREDGLLERADGRLRVAALRRGDEGGRRGRGRRGGLHGRRRRRRSDWAQDRVGLDRAGARAARGPGVASRGSRPAAGRRSSFSRARSCLRVAAIPAA